MKESDHQKKFIAYCKLNGLLVWSNQNETPYAKFINKATMMKLSQESNAMGRLKGLSDTIVMLPNCILFIEFKVGKNKQQKEQVQFEKHISKFDYAKYYLVYSCEEAISIVEQQK